MLFRRVVFVVPGSLDAPTGGSRYDRMMVAGLRDRGWAVDVVELNGAFPWPTPDDRASASSALDSLPGGCLTVVDGLALGALPDAVAQQAARLRLVALVHLPLAADVSLDAARAAQAAEGERRALAATCRVVVTGKATLSLLDRYGLSVPVRVVEPGTARRPIARGSRGPHVELLCVATLQPGKGHRVLLEALASLGSRPPGGGWRLTCAGSLTRDAATAAALQTQARAPDLESRVAFAGELDDAALAARYDESDIFVLATLQETYGMAVAEALAHGLPVVATSCGAIPELAGHGAGLIVPPGDAPALAAALAAVIDDADLRGRLAAGARQVRDRLPPPEEAAARFDAVLHEVLAHG